MLNNGTLANGTLNIGPLNSTLNTSTLHEQQYFEHWYYVCYVQYFESLHPRSDYGRQGSGEGDQDQLAVQSV